MPYIWEFSSGAYCLVSIVIIWQRMRWYFWGSQSPNHLELYRVQSTSLNCNFIQMGSQCRLWKIGIMHCLWLVPLSCWTAECCLGWGFYVVLKTGTTLTEVKPMFIQAYIQPKLYNCLGEWSAQSWGKVQHVQWEKVATMRSHPPLNSAFPKKFLHEQLLKR